MKRKQNWYKFIVWDYLVKKQYDRCYLCKYPLHTEERLNIHHILPVAQNGPVNDLDNLSIVHRSCHVRFHSPKHQKVKKFFLQA